MANPEERFSQTSAERMLADWMTLCAAPDLTQMTTWIQTHLSVAGAERKAPAVRAADAYELCTRNGGFRIHRTDWSGLHASLLAVGLKTNIWYTLQYIFDDAGQLDRFGDSPGAPPEESLPRPLTDSLIAREVGKQAGRLARAGLFSGIVVVSTPKRTIATSSVGYADKAKKSLITSDTQFTIGSVGKLFTAVAIGQLVDQKKMSFGDPVGRFFPDYPNATVRDQVTVAMLLSHTSGLDDFLDKRTSAMMQAGVTRAEEYLPLFDHDAPTFSPGSDWSYSNAGLVLAGAIVERVSGESYFDYVQRHVFDVAGMRSSDPNNHPRTHARLVTPYTKTQDPGRAPGWKVAEADIGSPAGGAISTPNDLLRFAGAMRDGKLVSRETLQALSTPGSRSPPGYQYGYATEIQEMFGQTAVGHSGGFPGVSVEFHWLRDSPYALVVMSNQDPPSAAYVGSWALALIAEKAKVDASAKTTTGSRQ